MSKSTALYKSVHYAFPTSPTAAQFRMARTGCWCVEVGEGLGHMKPIMAFETREEAAAQARALPYPFDRWSMHEKKG